MPKSIENDVFCDKFLLPSRNVKFSCVKMADKVVIVGKSTSRAKAKTTFSEEGT